MASATYCQHPIECCMYPSYSSSILGFSSFQNDISIAGIDHIRKRNRRFFSTSVGTKGTTQAINSVSSSTIPSHGGGGDWIGEVKKILESKVGTVILPYVQWLGTHPYTRDVVIPFCCTLVGTIFAWSLLPRILKRIHRYSNQGTEALLAGNSFWSSVPYEKSFWGAMEDPVRYFVTIMAFLELGLMIVPDVVAPHYVAHAWRGGFIVALVWFLNRLKVNLISRVMSTKNMDHGVRDRLLALDRISSLALFVFGSLVFAEASGVAVQSILTVGGIGGVATAFGARDILGNLLSGLYVQLSQPFSIGDKIRAGSIEGQVVSMGLTTTSLLTDDERFPVVVPNSLFCSQVIVNKSRAKWRFIVKNIPIRIDDILKIPQISEDIKSMLKSNPNVFLEREPPYCFLSQIERSYAELTLGCNIKHMNKEAEQDILLQAVHIIKKHGAELGRTLNDDDDDT